MKTGHGSIMDVEKVQQMSRKLVCLQILSQLRKPHIVPDHILGLVQGAVLHLLLAPLKSWKMVAVKHQNCRLIPTGQPIHQFLHKQVHIVNLLTIIGKRRVFSFYDKRSFFQNTSLFCENRCEKQQPIFKCFSYDSSYDQARDHH